MNHWRSAPILKKMDKPILTYKDIPYNAALIFNAGVAKFNGKYVMVFRNDYGDFENQILRGTNLGLAFSDDGINWEVNPEPWFSLQNDEISRVYDPRLTVIEDELYVCMAADTAHGLRGVVAKIKDLNSAPEILSMSLPDNRNMVLLPEKIGGNYIRFERPMPIYSRGGKDRFDMWMSESPDLVYWGKSRLIMGVEDVPFANDKIGPGAPPVKTDKGWLTTFHAVEIDHQKGKNGWESAWTKMYYAGIALLDLNDPSRVIGMYKKPLIACDKDFEEADGFRKDVIFPGGMILEDNGEVKIYYGASDTVECVATADVNELIALCLENQ